MAYINIFNMTRRHQEEGRLNDFLVWLFHHHHGVARWLVSRSGIDCDAVKEIGVRENSGGGAPDIVIRGRTTSGGEFVCAAEIKLGAFPTARQAEEYREWRENQEVEATSFVLIAPGTRTDLRTLAADKFIALEELVEECRKGEYSVPVASLAEELSDWYIEYEMSEASLLWSFAQQRFPYWPGGRILDLLKVRVDELGQKAEQKVLFASKVSSNRGKRIVRGFKIQTCADSRQLCWVGFYEYEDHGWFYVNIVEGLFTSEERTGLGIQEGSGIDARPYYWTLPPSHGPWRAGRLCADGFDKLVIAIREKTST